jgi:molecular chaperone GrpE (heat shock protein)
MYSKQYELHQVLAESGVQRVDAPANEFDDDIAEIVNIVSDSSV